MPAKASYTSSLRSHTLAAGGLKHLLADGNPELCLQVLELVALHHCSNFVLRISGTDLNLVPLIREAHES